MAKKKKKKKQVNAGARVADVFLSLVLVAGIGYCGYRTLSGFVKIDQTTTYADSVPENTTEPEQPTGIIFGNEEYPNTEVHNGSLILVNNFTPFTGSESNLISLYDAMLEAECRSFGVRDSALMVRPETAEALITMFDDFHAATGDDSIVVSSGHRTKEQQQAVYDMYESSVDPEAEDDGTLHRAALPGFSEHQTGYSVDLGLMEGDYDGTGVCEWVEDHCAEYGFILRYPEDKFDLTNIMFEPWHFRYVGFPHASIMMNQDMCMEEYIDFVKEYPYDGEHLRVADFDGKVYEIYYYAEDADYDSTMVPVPGGGLNYNVLGNNIDGFIVTIDTGETEKSTDTTEATEAASTDAVPIDGENTTDTESSAAE